MRGKATHKHAFRRLAEDQRSWANDPRYRLGESWCGESSLYSEAERDTSLARLADCPKCGAAMGAHKLARDYAGRVELVAVADAKESADYSIRYARSAYAFHLDGILRGYVIAEAGFGKGWRLRRLAGALGYASDADRLCGDSISGEKPARYSYSGATGKDAPFQPIHYVARDAMACAAVKAAERGELPTVEEQAERKAAQLERDREAAAQREIDRAASAARRAEREAQEAERRDVARMALDALGGRHDLSNVEAAGLDAIRTLLGMGAGAGAQPAT